MTPRNIAKIGNTSPRTTVVDSDSYRPRRLGPITLVIVIAIFPVLYIASTSLLSNYTLGDPLLYSRFYDRSASDTLQTIYSNQERFLMASEPFYALVVWLGTRLHLDHTVYISFYNGIFISLCFLTFYRYRASWLFLLLLLTNFYVFVLITSAERLKFALLILLLFSLTAGRLRYALLVASPLAHFQTLLLYVFTIPLYAKRLLSIRSTLYRTLSLSLLILVSLVTLYYFSTQLLDKAERYSRRSEGLAELAQLFVLLGIGLYLVRERTSFIISFCLAAVSVYGLGGDRVNMIFFIVLLIYLARSRQLNHPLTLLLMFYLSYKSIKFISNVYNYGDGFDINTDYFYN